MQRKRLLLLTILSFSTVCFAAMDGTNDDSPKNLKSHTPIQIDVPSGPNVPIGPDSHSGPDNHMPAGIDTAPITTPATNNDKETGSHK